MNCGFCEQELFWDIDKEGPILYHRALCSLCFYHLFSDTQPQQEVNAYFFHLTIKGVKYEWVSVRNDWLLRPSENGMTDIRIKEEKYPVRLLKIEEWIPPQSKEFHTNFINRIINLKAFL